MTITNDALVDTNINHVWNLAQCFKLAMMEELSASNTYAELLHKVDNELRYMCNDENCPADIKAQMIQLKNELERRVKEILKDEEQHFGSLLYCLNKLAPEIADNMNAGVQGK